MSSELVLVTAASGFIAGYIVKQLLESGYNVRGTVRNLKNANIKYKYLYDMVPSTNSKNTLELIECDLTKSLNWNKAISDCSYIIHTANPMPNTDINAKNQSMNADDFINPALNGMKFILEACLKNKSLKRFIYTSSRSAMIDCNKLMDDSNKIITYGSLQYTDINKIGQNEYAKSKVLTEQFAWKWIKDNNYPFEMCCINPSMVIGPLLNKRIPGSVAFFHRLLNGQIPLLPQSQMLMSDVRDVAMAHVHALKAQNVNGNRYLIANTNGLWANDIAMILLNDTNFKDYHDNIPKYEAPIWFVKIWAITDDAVKQFVVPRLNKLQIGYNQDSVRDLNVVYRPIHDSIIDTADSIIQWELAQKPKKSIINKKTVICVVAGLIMYYYFYFKNKS